MTAPTSSYDHEVSLAEVIAKLRVFAQTIWGERGMILRLMGGAAAVGLVIALGSPVEYSASMRLVPYRSAGAGGGLSGLAGLAGIRLPIGVSDQTITADLYPEVAKSLDFRIAVAETPLTFTSLARKASTVEYFRDLRTPSVTETIHSYTIGLPGRFLAGVRPAHKSAAGSPRADSTALRSYDQAYLELVGSLASRLSVSIDRKTSILNITGKMPDPYAAADLVRVASDRLMERIIDYESRKAGEQFRFVNEQFQQAKMRYERSQRELAVFTDRNRALMSATSQIDRDRLQRAYDLSFEVYQQLSRELEQARIKMSQDTPVFTVLEQVTVPTSRTSPQRSKIMLVAISLGALMGIGWIGVRQLVRSV